MKFSRRIFSNFQYKVAAVVLAALFWYIVQGEEVLEINRRIQVTIATKDGYMVKGPKIRLKDATLRGPRVLLGDFPTEPIEARINIPAGKTGQLRFRVDKEFIGGWDNRIKLTVYDSYINVLVDEVAKKTVPVREFTKGTPADGFIIEKTTINPPSVVVTGLASELGRITEVVTEPIDIEGLKESKGFKVRLAPKDVEVKNLSTDTVQIDLSIGDQKINKAFDNVPIEVVGSDYMSVANPRYVSIIIQGTPGVLKFIRRGDLEAFVEARDLAPGGKYARTIQVRIPPKTVLIETNPQNVSVEIYNEKRLN